MSQKRRFIKTTLEAFKAARPDAPAEQVARIQAGLKKFLSKPEGESMNKKYENDRRAQEEQFRATVEACQEVGYGRMMEIISGIWYRKDSKGALTVGECYGIEELKRERCKKEGHDVRKGNDWNWCDRCGVIIDPDTGKETTDC